ncbi:MAG: TRAP transporter substrate-binding protein DctP [Dehalococcoidia bacterium]|nr:TRAP transporter substrate-binding protein DctP [Dehalococcoidia bacterium]
MEKTIFRNKEVDKMFLKRVLPLVLVLVLAVTFLPGCAGEEEGPTGPSVTLQLSHQWSEGDVRDRLAHELADKVAEKSGGDMEITVYPAQSLYKAKAQWDGISTGGLDLTIYPLAYAAGKVPQVSITLMPAVFPNLDTAMAWGDSEAAQILEQDYMLPENVKVLGWLYFDGAIISRVKQIVRPEDCDGQVLRAAGSEFEYMFKKAGAAITSMPSPELYTALSTGVIDGCIGATSTWVSYKLYETVDYVNVPRDYCIWFMGEPLLVSTQTWDALTEEQQNILAESVDELWTNWVPAEISQLCGILDETFGDAGVERYYMTEEDFEVWKAFAENTSWKDFTDNVEGGQELLDLTLAFAEEYSAEE